MGIRVPRWLACAGLFAVVAVSVPAVARGQGPALPGWTFETIRGVTGIVGSCTAVVRFAGFAFDPAGRPVAGWSDTNECRPDYRWTRKENGGWTERTLTQPGAYGGIRGSAALKLRMDGTPFMAFAYPDGYVHGDTWHTAHVVNLEDSPYGPGSNWQAIESYRSCVSAFPEFALDFSPGALTPNWMVGTTCPYSGWLTLNGAAVHGAPPFQALVGNNGEYHSVAYATGPGGSHHATYYTERGGDNWGAYYTNGTPGHEVFLARPHRNRAAETSVAVGADGRIHVVVGGIPLCGNTYEGGLLYLTSTDGANWSRTFVDVSSGRNPSIAIDAGGNPQIAYWHFDNQVRLASLQNGAWTTAAVYSAAAAVPLTSVKLTTDGSGRPNVLFFNPDTSEIQVATGNAASGAPVVTTPAPQFSAPGSAASLQIAASDAQNDVLTFEACGLPPGLAVDPSTGLVTGTLSPTEIMGTIYTVTMTVTDTAGNTATVTFTWTIRTNAGPSVTVPANQVNDEGQQASVFVSGTDPDEDPLTFSADGLPPGLAISPTTGEISGTLAAGSAGSYTVSVAVSDGQASSTGSFGWTVNVVAPPPPPPPPPPPGSNTTPVCSSARPTLAVLWPPNHKQTHIVGVAGVTDADADQISITITGILQDEPTNTAGDGSSTVDGFGVGTPEARVRAERVGTPRVPGDGRVYEILFTAGDGRGGSCSGAVIVGVPHDMARAAVDSLVRFDSTVAGGARVR